MDPGIVPWAQPTFFALIRLPNAATLKLISRRIDPETFELMVLALFCNRIHESV